MRNWPQRTQRRARIEIIAMIDVMMFLLVFFFRARVDDLSNALFLRVGARVNARLWVLDTIVTAAPLLGFLGTILGIMQTFTALAAGGVSDPAEVSPGINTVLLATAIGIGTALYGLVGLNMLSRQAEYLVDRFKTFLLRCPA